VITDLKRGIAVLLLGIGIVFIVLAFKIDYAYTMMRYETAKEKMEGK